MQWKVKEESECVVQTSHEKETKRNRRKKGGKRRESSIRTIDIDIILSVYKDRESVSARGAGATTTAVKSELSPRVAIKGLYPLKAI